MGSHISYSQSKSEVYYQNPREEMLGFIPKNVKRTLEFGCGCGLFSELVKKELDAECWGVEIEEKYAQIAAEKLDRVIRSDAGDSIAILPDGYFDCIILNDVLEHLEDPFSLLENLKSKVTSNGVVVLSIPNVRFWNNLRAFIWRGEWDYEDAGILDSTHLRFFTHKSLLRMFQKLGYEVLNIEGLRPTHNKKFRVLNFLLWNRLWDARYHQFACVVKPAGGKRSGNE
jgi:2-polyprenyl-3-methyl-5-hydroxy-6-metoxy-1,4-benzoquinol methylase